MGDAYDLDRAPIVMRATRWRMGIALLLMVVLLAIGLRQFSGAPDWAQNLALVFFTGLVGLMIAQVFKPPTLTLSSEGLAWGALLRTRRWNWSQIGDFRRASIGVGFDYVDGRFELLRRVNGFSCILLPFWDIPSDELVELLEHARARWA